MSKMILIYSFRFHMWTGRAAFILHQLFSHLGYNFLQTRVSLCSSKKYFLCVQVHVAPLSLSIKPAHVAVDHRKPLDSDRRL